MKTLRYYNLSHAGDALFDSILLNRLTGHKIEYFMHPKYREAVREWFAPHVTLTDYMPEGAEEIWITHTLHGCVNGMQKFFPGVRPHPSPHIYNQVYLDHFRAICQRAEIECPFKSKEEICHTQSDLNKPGRSYDWLVINSECLSGQIPFWDEARLARIARALPGRVVTTHPVPGLICTRDVAPSLFNIGQLAGRCRFVVGINTGPMIAALTQRMLDRVECFLVLDLLHGFDYRHKTFWTRTLDEFEASCLSLRKRVSAASGLPERLPRRGVSASAVAAQQ